MEIRSYGGLAGFSNRFFLVGGRLQEEAETPMTALSLSGRLWYPQIVVPEADCLRVVILG